jgi:hypothetical protein
MHAVDSWFRIPCPKDGVLLPAEAFGKGSIELLGVLCFSVFVTAAERLMNDEILYCSWFLSENQYRGENGSR